MSDGKNAQFPKENIEAALDNLSAVGALEKYRRIMDIPPNVADDSQEAGEFRRMYNHFYRVQRRKPEWYTAYYNLMQRNREIDSLTFQQVIESLHKETGWG